MWEVWGDEIITQDLRNEDLSLRPKRSVGKQSQDFCDYVAVARNDAVTLLLRKSYNYQLSTINHHSLTPHTPQMGTSIAVFGTHTNNMTRNLW